VVIQLHRSLKVQKVLPDGEPEARELWQRAYGELHAAVLTGCNSPLLMQIQGDLGARLERYVNLFGDMESDRNRDHHAEHRQIVDALVARDAEKLLALIERYFAVGQPIRNSIIEALKGREKAASASGRRQAVDKAAVTLLPPARGARGRAKKTPAAKRRAAV
jgi:GntR family carbon starvation induced transcriptional regulator